MEDSDAPKCSNVQRNPDAGRDDTSPHILKLLAALCHASNKRLREGDESPLSSVLYPDKGKKNE